METERLREAGHFLGLTSISWVDITYPTKNTMFVMKGHFLRFVMYSFLEHIVKLSANESSSLKYLTKVPEF